MSYLEALEEARKLIDEALGEGRIEFDVSEPTVAGMGDIASNVAFSAAKVLRKPPGEIAAELVRKVKPSVLFERVEAHPKGYINFTINYPVYATKLLERVLSREFGRLDIGRGKKVVVEHTSVNPNKALHIGHARNVVVGDTVARILKRAGYDLSVLNYIDDTGVQVADIIVGFLYLGMKPEIEGTKFDHYCGDEVYVKVNEAYEESPEVLERRKEVLKQLEEGEGPIAEFAEKVIKRVVEEQLKTCWRLGAEYDLLNWESHILRTGYWREVFEELKRRGFIELAEEGKYAGCWVIKGQEGEEKVLVRSDGTAVYAAKDIPYAAWKLGLLEDRFGYDVFAEQPSGGKLWTTVARGGKREHPRFNDGDMAITIIDVRQSRVQKFVSMAVKALGGEGKEYVHLGYEVVALSKDTADELGVKVKEDREFYHMSGRKGLYVNVDDVLDELERRAREESRMRNPDGDERWIAGVGRKVAVGALRYALLKQDLEKIIVFDMKEALRLEGDTGPYLQYSLARAYRILEKAGQFEPRPDLGKHLVAEEERALVLMMSKYEKVLLEAVKNLSPKRLANYARELAVSFNQFYEKRPVLQEKDERVRSARLALVKAYTELYSDLLEAMGIPPLERL